MRYIGNKKELTELLTRHDFNLKKNFGQNFLIDTNILQKIVKSSGISNKTTTIEVGPGAGALTQFLATESKEVVAFEIDTKLEPLLQETALSFDNVEVIFGDFLKTDLTTIPTLQAAEEIRVVANLPYYITTPILEKLIEWFILDEPPLKSATVMMQKEVAERLTAKPGTKAYGSLSIFIQLFAKVSVSFTVSRHVFIPPPNVDSAIIQLEFQKPEAFANYEEAIAFTKLVRQSFAQRRKTLVNNLKEEYDGQEVRDALIKIGEKDNVRAEALSISQFIAFYKIFMKIV